MTMDEFVLPAKRDVPAQVRERVWARVTAGIDGGDERHHVGDRSPGRQFARWGRVVVPVAVAVGVVAVAVGGLGAGGSGKTLDGAVGMGGLATGPVVVAGVSAPLDKDSVAEQLERCWDTVRQSGSVARFPARDQWQASFQVSSPLVTVTAVKAGGKPFFCETTRATVHVTAPDQPPATIPGTATGALLASSNGPLAGVLDPAWPAVRVAVDAPSRDGEEGDAIVKDGMFVFLPGLTGKVRVQAPDGTFLPLPKPADPAVSTRTLPDADEGKLRDCIRAARDFTVIVDEGTWSPGAAVEADGQRIVFAVNDAGVSVCVNQKVRAGFGSYLTTAPVTKPALLGIMPSLAGRPVMAGVVPPNAARTELIMPDGETVQADTARGTFVALLPEESDGKVRCKVYDAADNLLYDGPFA
ncbi:hypothetical protein [Actinokineospora enzanensis]|uniref:hypothetical protein n=1 Tax=Actinokineospora enzanensis TaxID=155975 RepID=UPI00035CB9AD|nr:hypothetical protein [Actinokineospora enzanensis]